MATMVEETEFAIDTTVNNPAVASVQDITGLVDKTVFLKVRFGRLGNTRKVSENVLTTDANHDLLKVTKTLLESKEFDAIRTADSKMTAYLNNVCLPFDAGVKLLPIGLIEIVQKRMQLHKTERAELVSAFVAVYPDLCKSATSRLGSLYNPGDYPPVQALASMFVFEWQYVTIGIPGQLKGISAGLFQAEQEKMQATMAEAASEITSVMRQTLLEMVSHLQDRLADDGSGKKKIFRDSAVKNLQEFLHLFDMRNVTDDKQLAELVAKAKTLLTGTNAEALRNSDVFRSKVHAGMADVAASLATLVEVKPGRKFRQDGE